MKTLCCFRFIFLLLLFSGPGMWAQSDDSSMASVQFDTSGFPQWAKDLRRAEIVAFGAFPFTYFFTNFSVDLYRCGTNDWDQRYAPWPFKAAGAVEQTQDQKLMTLGIAAGGAVVIALVDFGIERFRRSRREQAARIQEGTPIIIRKPLHENVPDEEAPPETGNL
jgi:hypothetical protein